MKQSSRWIVLFSLAFAFLFISPALFNQQFSLYPLMKVGDVIDLFTPIVLIPLYWLLYQTDREKPVPFLEMLLFIGLAAVWIEGQGSHLVANSIGHLLKTQTGSDAYALTHFYDEVLSHYLWHGGIFGMMILLLWKQWKTPLQSVDTSLWINVSAGVLHGLTYFIIVDEAVTWLLGLPVALGIVVFTLVRGRNKLREQPLLTFFFVTCLVALVLFVGWAIYWQFHGGCVSPLPEFSDPCVGMIE
jgi:hypothetical protein